MVMMVLVLVTVSFDDSVGFRDGNVLGDGNGFRDGDGDGDGRWPSRVEVGTRKTGRVEES